MTAEDMRKFVVRVVVVVLRLVFLQLAGTCEYPTSVHDCEGNEKRSQAQEQERTAYPYEKLVRIFAGIPAK
uniref:Putative secreted protein n=1 Tax=Rhipicephalus microplus TaxID=6941 RepID=A0A6M2DF46_RHIMP